MRFITIFLIILCSLQASSQTSLSEIQTAPTSYTTTGSIKNFSLPFSYSMSGSPGTANLMTITNWGFKSIPSNVFSITGVVFTMNFTNASNISITSIQLVDSKGFSKDLVTTNLIPVGTGSYTFGNFDGLSTEWQNVGTGPLTAADVLSPQFGVAIDATKNSNSSGKLDITSLSLTVFYTALLPVSLSKFDVARINGDQVNVNWETSSEANVEMIYVERSKDARNFSTLFEVKPRGTNYGTTSYQVVDKTPLSGTSYYRLREKDIDGVNIYHPIQKISINTTLTRFHAKFRESFVAVDLSGNNGLYQLSLVNMNGQLIKRTGIMMTDGNAHVDFDATSLKAGMYLVNVIGNGFNKTEKVFIAR